MGPNNPSASVPSSRSEEGSVTNLAGLYPGGGEADLPFLPFINVWRFRDSIEQRQKILE